MGSWRRTLEKTREGSSVFWEDWEVFWQRISHTSGLSEDRLRRWRHRMACYACFYATATRLRTLQFCLGISHSILCEEQLHHMRRQLPACCTPPSIDGTQKKLVLG